MQRPEFAHGGAANDARRAVADAGSNAGPAAAAATDPLPPLTLARRRVGLGRHADDQRLFRGRTRGRDDFGRRRRRLRSRGAHGRGGRGRSTPLVRGRLNRGRRWRLRTLPRDQVDNDERRRRVQGRLGPAYAQKHKGAEVQKSHKPRRAPAPMSHSFRPQPRLPLRLPNANASEVEKDQTLCRLRRPAPRRWRPPRRRCRPCRRPRSACPALHSREAAARSGDCRPPDGP